MKQNPIHITTSTTLIVAKNTGPISRLIIMAPTQLPTIYELMYQTQKQPKQNPLVSSVAHIVMYSPWQIHSQDKPHPLIHAETTKIIEMKVWLTKIAYHQSRTYTLVAAFSGLSRKPYQAGRILAIRIKLKHIPPITKIFYIPILFIIDGPTIAPIVWKM